MIRAARGAARILRGDRGDTMLEVVIAVTLVGIAFSAIFGGLSTASLAAKQQNDSVQLEAALSQARQQLEVEPFDGTGAYAGVTLPAPSCGPPVSKVVSQVTPAPASTASPLPTSQVQRIRLQASCGAQTRVADTLKGNRTP